MKRNNNRLKMDCFAFENGGCSALNEMVCYKKDCRFYKRLDQLIYEREKCARRLEAIGRPNQAKDIRKLNKLSNL